jgi:hypothetical protein
LPLAVTMQPVEPTLKRRITYRYATKLAEAAIMSGSFRLTKLPQRPKIHENTLILTRRALKQLFEFSTVV